MDATLVEPLAGFQKGKAWVVIFANQDDLGRAAATQAAGVIADAILKQRRARIIVGTGNSQDRLIHWLTQQPGIDWRAVEIFHMDEYVGMPAAHSASFARWLK